MENNSDRPIPDNIELRSIEDWTLNLGKRTLIMSYLSNSLVLISYWFISTLFTKFRLEHQHKYFNMDSVILTCGGIMLMALALLDSRLLSTSFKTTTLIIFVLVLTISNFIKIIFFYISAPNSTHALCSSISLFLNLTLI